MIQFLAYINTLTNALCGIDLLLSPEYIVTFLGGISLPTEGAIQYLLATIAKDPAIVFSLIVWTLVLFAVVSLALLIPWRLFKSITRGVGGIK